jgi:SAM-dependent methyltransferase
MSVDAGQPGRLGRVVKRLLLFLFRRSIIRQQYEYLSRLDKDGQITLMNYGYADPDPAAPQLPLDEHDEGERYSIQLYHHVAGAVDLTDRDVLEVGCGRGGGASYIMRYLHPRSVIGVDFCKGAIDFCTWHYDMDGMEFVRGDAEKLRFDDASFDAVVNIESSHCYGHVDRFLQEVCRVLRPEGHFLYADFRLGGGVQELRDLLTASSLTLIREEDITAQVLAALDLDSERKADLIRRKVPERLHESFKTFAATKGTPIYEGMKNGTITYLFFVLRKPGN